MKDKSGHFFHMLFLFAVLAAGIAWLNPVTTAAASSKGSETKGRYHFRQTCKTCHTKGAKGGEITPLSKTMTQWRGYFKAGMHGRGKEPLSKYLEQDQLLDVHAFLVAHAADSLQPETCGKD